MKRRFVYARFVYACFAYVLSLGLAALTVTTLVAQPPEDYLDTTVIRVKPEKRSEFDALSRKFVEINRQNKGDTWLAYEPLYGEQNAVYFVSPRKNFAAIDDGFNAVMAAFMKALGPAGMAKIFQESNNTTSSARGEIRRRRWDLSANVPGDSAASNKLIGESRWLRITTVRVRPGHALDYEQQLKDHKGAQERGNPGVSFFVSQTAAGGAPSTFYITALVKSLGDFDKIKGLADVLGAGNYAHYQQSVANSVASVDITIARFVPELSNPPDDVAKVDPQFWRPKPPAAAKPKAKEAKK